MRPLLLKITTQSARSFSARVDRSPDINNIWHYHPEMEMIYIKKGEGTQYIGDDIRSFKDGHIVLLGSNLPHYWQYARHYFDHADQMSIEVYVIHFSSDFWGAGFLNLPENTELKKLIDSSRRGIQLTNCHQTRLGLAMEAIVTGKDHRKILNLMDALLEMAENENKEYLASVGFQGSFQEAERDRIQTVFNYTLKNYKKRIDLDEIAGVAKMSRPAFCKFFKAKTGKTYSSFINEIRIGNACRLLIENNMSVKEICFESGFNNFVSFHQSFKFIKGNTPLQYQKIYNK